MQHTRALRRSSRDRMFGGVVAGMADYLGIDPTLARILYVLVSVLSTGFPGLLVYFICWIVIPEE